MTTTEFRLEFDTLYDNITSGAAPGLDDYERSYFLSKAQDELVKSWYDKRFEQTEKFRRALASLVAFHTSSTTITTADKLVPEMQVFTIPDDVQYIVVERAVTDGGLTIDVKPVTNDELTVVIRDPFRKPSVNKIEKYAVRLDRDLSGSTRVVELLVYDDTIDTYSLRYIKKPTPIVLSNLLELQAGLSIEGVSSETQCGLDSSVHREIIDRAVELALEAFEQQRLSTKVQLNERNK